MAAPNDTDEAVAKERLCPQLRPHVRADDADFPESMVPSRKGALSLSGFGRNHRRTPGASAPMRAISAGPKVSANPSRLRMLKVRSSRARVERLDRPERGTGRLDQ